VKDFEDSMLRPATFLIGVLMAASALAQTPSSPIPAPLSSAPPQAIASEASVGARDVLEVRVFQDPSFNTRATVGDDGSISMPPLGKIPVAGLTLTQVEQKIKLILESRLLQKADVSVELIEAGSKPISVIGAVTKPGRIGITGNISLMQAITAAGGLAPGYGRTLYVLRTAANGLTEQIAVDVDDLMVNGNSDINLPLRANDVINVPIEQMISIYVLGEAMKPGVVQFRSSQHPTLLQALSMAGGPTDRAANTLLLKRMATDGKMGTTQYNFRRIVSGRENDVPLKDGDTIYINASFF
jgi:polysaccharide export outer membrane protein